MCWQDEPTADRAELEGLDLREQNQMADAEADQAAWPHSAGPIRPAPTNEGGMAQPRTPETAARTEIRELRLYVTDHSPKCVLAMENLQRTCEQHLAGRHQIEVVDLLENPRRAADDQILAVPTLVRKPPEPVRKIVGDLSDIDRLLVGLQLRPRTGEAT